MKNMFKIAALSLAVLLLAFAFVGCGKKDDGKVYKIALAEVYNLRCFEIKDGHMTGPMVKIHPLSDLAKSLKEVG